MEKLKEFNKELKALLDKYGYLLSINQNIVIVPNKKMEEEKVEEKVEETPVEETTEVEITDVE
jgi:hypothetical protein